MWILLYQETHNSHYKPIIILPMLQIPAFDKPSRRRVRCARKDNIRGWKIACVYDCSRMSFWFLVSVRKLMIIIIISMCVGAWIIMTMVLVGTRRIGQHPNEQSKECEK